MGAKKMNRKADRWGLAGSESSLASQRVREVQDWAGMLGLRELMGHACGWEKKEGIGRSAGLASLGQAAGCEALSLHLSFSFSFVLCLFA